ncbi:MAG: ABC transporter permease [Streptosporangiaceae bacterium]
MTTTALAGRAPARPARAVNPWVSFAARRLGRLVVSLFLLISGAWAMIHAIPGDPVRAALGITAPQSLVKAERRALGLDKPLLTQYWQFVHGVLTGHLGVSLTYRLPVTEIIGARLPATAEIAGLAFVVVMLVSVPLGMAAGVVTRDDRHRGAEMAFSGVTGTLAAIPQFLLAVGLVAAFAVGLHVLPAAGRAGSASYLLPVISLAAGGVVLLARVVRVETIRVLHEDYMRTARAKRLPARLVYARHALPNLLTSTLTLGGLALAGLIAGTVLVENVFAWPGMGTALVQSITQKDYPLAQGFALVYGAAVLLINLVVDVLIAVVDPRSTMRET